MCVTVRGRGRLARECGLSARVGAIAHTHDIQTQQPETIGRRGRGLGPCLPPNCQRLLDKQGSAIQHPSSSGRVGYGGRLLTDWACVPRRFESCLLRQSDLIEDPVGNGV